MTFKPSTPSKVTSTRVDTKKIHLTYTLNCKTGISPELPIKSYLIADEDLSLGIEIFFQLRPETWPPLVNL